MRIAHVTDGYLPRLGGIETQVHDLAWAQLRAGHDVEIVTATPSSIPDALVVHRPSGEGTGKPVRLGTDRALSGRYDVLHVHLSIASPLALSVLWRAVADGVPAVATTHSLWGPAESVLAGARRVLGRRAGAVSWTAVSSAAARPLRRHLGVPVAVVPNGVDVDWWAGAQRHPATGGVRALSVMRLSRRKRPVPLARMVAAAGTASAGARLSLTVVGDGRQAGRLLRETTRRDVDVALPGRLTRSAIRDLMDAHDVYVAPAPLESFGLAALEARSAGLPVIAFPRSGVADFICDGWDGILVDDDAGLTAAIAELVGRPALLRQLQANADTRPDLGWPVTLTGYARQYERACRSRLVLSLPRRPVALA